MIALNLNQKAFGNRRSWNNSLGWRKTWHYSARIFSYATEYRTSKSVE